MTYNIPTTKKTARKCLTDCYNIEKMVEAAGVESASCYSGLIKIVGNGKDTNGPDGLKLE